MIGTLIQMDRALFRFINGHCQNPLGDALLPVLGGSMGGYPVFFLAVVLMVLGTKSRKGTGILLAGALSVEYYTVRFLKEFFARPRPALTLTDVRLLQEPAGYAFPSGHTTIAFLCATILSRAFPRLRGLFLSLAVIVAFARVYVGAHYPADVVAGALTGMVLGWGLIVIGDRAGLSVEKKA